MMTPGDIDKLQKECDFEYMKEKIEKQQTQINSLINKEEIQCYRRRRGNKF